jgi:S1-C subfamily serine protease
MRIGRLEEEKYVASREVLSRVKSATVALAIKTPGPPDPNRMPFIIVGSGFCIDPSGIVITCEHVIAAFTKQNIREVIAAMPLEGKKNTIVPIEGLDSVAPEVLFFLFNGVKDEMALIPAPVEAAVAKLEYDLGAIRIGPHRAFSAGYPYLEIEDFTEMYEGMELGTCGFPMGNALHDQLGTASSSFTRGILSSIAPAPGAKEELVNGLQLDITATFGNSGGPVFGWTSGKVLGVLQGGPVQPDRTPLPGLARAEPIYRIITDGTITRLKNSQPPPNWHPNE